MKRHNIDGDRIFTIDDFLSADKCTELIEMSESMGYSEAPITTGSGFEMRKDIRNNTRVMFDDRELAESLWDGLREFMPDPFGDRHPVELNERLRFYRYTPGQKFAPHVDGYFRRENGEKSRFTFMVYLNDDFSNGGTRFLEPMSHTVRPRTGKALVFYHHQVHEGQIVLDGTKYVLRTDVMYSA